MSPNPYENANVYSNNQKAQTVPTGNSRETDSRALAACARRLDDAKILMENDGESRENLKLYAEAIRHNQRLWTIFQVALCDPENPLPQDLKITLLNLSRYVDKTSFRAIGKYTPDAINSLIHINRSIAFGLNKKPSGESMTMTLPDARDVPTMLMTSA
jgi:flagellar protein FlaF